MSQHTYDDRRERELDWIFNPSAPLTEEVLDLLTGEASGLLLDMLIHCETEKEVTP